jgi:hypothetical protein
VLSCTSGTAWTRKREESRVRSRKATGERERIVEEEIGERDGKMGWTKVVEPSPCG